MSCLSFFIFSPWILIVRSLFHLFLFIKPWNEQSWNRRYLSHSISFCFLGCAHCVHFVENFWVREKLLRKTEFALYTKFSLETLLYYWATLAPTLTSQFGTKANLVIHNLRTDWARNCVGNYILHSSFFKKWG